VKSFDELAAELQATWHREIPLAAAMEVSVASCASDEIAVRAPLLPNRNLHGTAFAGSLFSVCVLTGWGMTWIALQRRNLTGVIVVADSRIRYRKAVGNEILCRCRAETGLLDENLARLAASGRASLPLVCTIEADGKAAVTFEAKYVVHTRSEH
jgi:thioesterase domain-containing protein